MRGAFQAIAVIFKITFSQIVWSKRTIFFGFVVMIPVAIGIFFRIDPTAPAIYYEFFAKFVSVVFLNFLSLLLSLFYGTAAIGDEIDNKTITYLFTRPIQKYCLILGKYLALLCGISIMMWSSILFTYLLIASKQGWSNIFLDMNIFFKYLRVMFLASMAYGSVFLLFGALFKRSVLFGMLFAFGWETVMTKIPGNIRQLTILHYLTSLLPRDHIAWDSMFKNATDFNTSVWSILGITFIFIGLSTFVIYRKEYRFDSATA